MKKSKELFSNEQISSIEDVIKQVEKTTSAELVPVIASSSGRYDRAEDVFAFILSLLVLTSLWFGFQENILSQGWGEGTSIALGLPAILSVLSLSFVVGMVLATYIPILRLPFIAKREMLEEVERSAREVFQKFNIRKTGDAIGVLIYVSLYEQMVYVLGDDSINEKLTESDLQEVCEIITNGFKYRSPDKGMQQGILRCGEFLAQHFPVQPDDVNELNDKLYLFD